MRPSPTTLTLTVEFDMLAVPKIVFVRMGRLVVTNSMFLAIVR